MFEDELFVSYRSGMTFLQKFVSFPELVFYIFMAEMTLDPKKIFFILAILQRIIHFMGLNVAFVRNLIEKLSENTLEMLFSDVLRVNNHKNRKNLAFTQSYNLKMQLTIKLMFFLSKSLF